MQISTKTVRLTVTTEYRWRKGSNNPYVVRLRNKNRCIAEVHQNQVTKEWKAYLNYNGPHGAKFWWWPGDDGYNHHDISFKTAFDAQEWVEERLSKVFEKHPEYAIDIY